eukprot:TRINITY_DN1021_c0_g1_i1.p1 TRINITY_DN1021_c0_g1~~TRINITY_DN1021_c0_g1_i1.p1  ORF type:complete len:759 (+),score=283.00 TRINITY_DN1021_c0_g1_i1:679-2955(+)
MACCATEEPTPGTSGSNVNVGLIYLQRGGVILKTPKTGLALQFGIPPETIKDCMTLGIPVPSYYVFPKVLFDRQKFVNVAEAEFPAYYNFFVMKKPVTFICTPAQEASMRLVFQETLLGPKDIDVRHEFADGADDTVPDVQRECAYIRTFSSIDELFNFVHFDADGVATLEAEGVRIVDRGDEFAVFEHGTEVGRAPSKVKLPTALYQHSVLAGSACQPPFEPPLLGVTILGSGHGFDPSHRTSGFVLWINKRGIMVDPPLNSRALLQQNGVPSRLVDTVIVTHCHADHDQGTLQKMLEERQVTLITTSTIMGSFLRKYSALTGVSADGLRRLFVFRPVVFNEPMRINGGEIRFFYSIHTIPCIGFEVYYGGKSIYFSGDTCYDPAFIRSMHQAGVLRDGRAAWLLDERWQQHSLILHEAGVPPIHTPVSILAALNDDIKGRLWVIHTSHKALPPGSGLKIAPEGVENTLVLNVQPHVHSGAIELLKVIDEIDMFRVFALAQARELLQNAMPRHYAAGATIIEKDSLGRELYIITAGVVVISDASWSKHFVVGDYFGEMSLVTGSRRSAQAKAKTDVDVVAFTKEDFFAVLRGNTDTISFLLNLSQRRQEPSWQILSSNAVLHWMTNAQKTRLQALLRRRTLAAGDYVWRAGQPASQALLVGSGSVCIEEKAAELEPFGPGSWLAETSALLDARPLSMSVKALTDGWAYTVEREQLLAFFDDNPGVKLSFLDTNFIDVVKHDDALLPVAADDDQLVSF